MQNNHPKQFRLNAEVALMILVAMIALSAPIVCVIIAVKIFTKAPAKVAATTMSLEPMRQALETAAEKELAAPALASGDVSVEIETPEPAAAAREVSRTATAFGGLAIISSESRTAIEVLAHIPENRVAAFVAVCRGGPPDIPKTPATPATRFVKILLKSPAQ